MTSSQRSDLPQGTFVLLILRVAAVSPIHGYAIARRIQEISRDVLQVVMVEETTEALATVNAATILALSHIPTKCSRRKSVAR